MYLRIKQEKILLNGGIPKCLFLTFLNPGPSTILAPSTMQISFDHVGAKNKETWDSHV